LNEGEKGALNPDVERGGGVLLRRGAWGNTGKRRNAKRLGGVTSEFLEDSAAEAQHTHRMDT